MPQSVLEIDELLRPVIDKLVGTSPQAAVSLASEGATFVDQPLKGAAKLHLC